MNKPLNLLIVEDSSDDADLLLAELRRAGFAPTGKRIQTESDFLAELKNSPEIILSDYSMPEFSGLQAAELLRKSGSDIPFILISGVMGEEVAVEAMRQGATDYLLKDRLTRLGSAVERALRELQEHRQFKKAEQQITLQNRALEQFRERLVLATTSAHIGIWDWDVVADRLVWDAKMYELYGIRESDFSGAYEAWQKGLHPEDREKGAAAIAAAIAGAEDFEIEFRVLWPNGEVHHLEAHAVVQRAPNGSALRMIGVNRDITERKRAEANLEQTHKELVKASRLAGMTEFASGVLHNVGNVLNSINVASTCMSDSLKRSKSASLAKVVALMRQNETDLGDFFTRDPKGKQLPGYLAQLAEHLDREHATTLQELAELQQNVEHIKHLVTTQQDSAKMSRLPELTPLADLVEAALKLNANGFSSAGIQVRREFAAVPAIMTPKHMVLQILVNLVRNAQQACEGSGGAEKCLTIRLSQEAGRIRIAVTDNGSGISPENLPRIFAHGFTTKKDGHGFGLHSAAAAAGELGGSLSVQSGGLGRGATFTLELPMNS